MELNSYFLDTYAMHEIIVANPDYIRYTTDVVLVTTRLNLMELYYGLLLKYGIIEANKYFDIFLKFAIDYSDETIKKAMLFRVKNKKKDLSYTDCIGYILALERNIKFLTGDKEFKDLPGVEFVK